MKKEIIFFGKGGQGLGVMGKILALSAIFEGKEVSSSPSYGGEVTGGLSQSEVIISDEKIDFPAVLEPNVLVLFSQMAIPETKKKIAIFYDPDLIDAEKLPREHELISVPATKMAVEVLKEKRTANMIVLGAVVAKTQMVKPESVIKIIREELKGKNPELNEKAFLEGFRLRLDEV